MPDQALWTAPRPTTATSPGYGNDEPIWPPAAPAVPELVLTEVAADSFARADGPIGSGWAAISSGGMSIAGGEAIGVNNTITGNYRTETYSSDQYSQLEVGSIALTEGAFLGPTVRNQDAENCYVLIYFENSQRAAGTYELDFYKCVAGSFTLLAEFTINGPLAASTLLTLIAEGSQLTAWVDDTPAFSMIDTTFTGGAPGIISFDAVAVDDWQGGNAQTGAVGPAIASDNFARANGGLSVGQADWEILTGYPAVDIPILADQLHSSSGSHAADVRTDTYDADQWSAIQMGSADPNNSGFVGLLTRINAALNSGYLGVAFGNPLAGGSDPNTSIAYRIYRLDNGASVLLATVTTTQPNQLLTDPPGTAYTLVSDGARHSFRINGAEVVVAIDATYPDGQPGIMLYPTSTADNWTGGNV